MLKDIEVKRLVEAISDYQDLIAQAGDTRDKLSTLQQRWNSLREERGALRVGLDSLHEQVSQMKADYQTLMKRATDVSATEDGILDNVKFLIDELTSLLRKHEDEE
jgi:uncharacterized protein involved in exopolysaccharide biosynthesis